MEGKFTTSSALGLVTFHYRIQLNYEIIKITSLRKETGKDSFKFGC